MGRPRKNPDDPKWHKPPEYTAWQLYFAAAMTGLIAKGGLGMDTLLKTAMQFADEAVAATEAL